MAEAPLSPSSAAAATTADQSRRKENLCENCDEHPVTLWCRACRMEFCDRCDKDYHRPVKMSSHVRKARFPTAIADILQMCEKEGKASDYGATKPEGKNIFKYVLDYEEGYYYLFKNTSQLLHLDAEMDFNMSNLSIVSFPPDTRKLKISLPPLSMQFVHLKRTDPNAKCSCEITQRFALNPPRPGRLPSVSIPVVYDIDTPLEELEKQTEREGVCTDHGSQDQGGMSIHQYQWEFSGGYCFLWVNSSKDILFHKELTLELKNLAIVDAPEGEKKFVVDLKPGERKSMRLACIDKKSAYGVSMRAGFCLPRIKSTAGTGTGSGANTSRNAGTGATNPGSGDVSPRPSSGDGGPSPAALFAKARAAPRTPTTPATPAAATTTTEPPTPAAPSPATTAAGGDIPEETTPAAASS